MSLDPDVAKQRKAAMSSGNRYKPSGGANYIRVLPIKHKVVQADVDAGLFTKDKIGKTLTLLDRPINHVFVPGTDGRKHPRVATAKDVEVYSVLANSSNEADQAAAQTKKPKMGYFINVVNMEERPLKIRHWAAPKKIANEIYGMDAKEDEFGVILGAKGRDIMFTFDKNKQGSEMYGDIKLRDREKSKVLPEDLEKKVYDFFTDAGMKEIGFGPAPVPKTAKQVKEEDESLDKPVEEEEVEKEEEDETEEE